MRIVYSIEEVFLAGIVRISPCPEACSSDIDCIRPRSDHRFKTGQRSCRCK